MVRTVNLVPSASSDLNLGVLSLGSTCHPVRFSPRSYGHLQSVVKSPCYPSWAASIEGLRLDEVVKVRIGQERTEEEAGAIPY